MLNYNTIIISRLNTMYAKGNITRSTVERFEHLLLKL